jgi:hypothetical protein
MICGKIYRDLIYSLFYHGLGPDYPVIMVSCDLDEADIINPKINKIINNTPDLLLPSPNLWFHYNVGKNIVMSHMCRYKYVDGEIKFVLDFDYTLHSCEIWANGYQKAKLEIPE